jgi:hypothetical protein
MAAIVIPESLKQYIPKHVDPAQIWVRYNQDADSLIIYFTGNPVPTVWNDVDEYAYLGFSLDDETELTGVMIEHFSKWLLVPGLGSRELQLAS